MKIYLLLLAVSLPLVACGVKPKTVDAPAGVENDEFPRQYPASK